MTTLHGYCLCKTIQITVHRNPQKTFLCYCQDCQRSAGGPCQAVAAFSSSNITITDSTIAEPNQDQDLLSLASSSASLSVYTIPGSETASGHAKPKVFCTKCGCTIATVPAKWGGKVVVLRPNLLIKGLESDGVAPTEEWFVAARPKEFSGWMGAEKYESVP